MKLWLINRTDHVDYDEWDAAVVAAETEQQASDTHPNGVPTHWGGWPDDTSLIEVTLIGTAKRGTKAGVICASFNAG